MPAIVDHIRKDRLVLTTQVGTSVYTLFSGIVKRTRLNFPKSKLPINMLTAQSSLVVAEVPGS